MSVLYLDTSALVKCYLTEMGSGWTTALLSADPPPTVLTSILTIVESVCAFARRRREGTFPAADYAQILTAFDYDVPYRYDLVLVERPVIDAARQLAERHPLRAYDAVHLASAWLSNQALRQTGRPPLTFLSADDHLLAAAQAEGLLSDNPNRHP